MSVYKVNFWFCIGSASSSTTAGHEPGQGGSPVRTCSGRAVQATAAQPRPVETGLGGQLSCAAAAADAQLMDAVMGAE